MLIIAKTPAPVSVEAGHYFQGRQGKMFWGKLREYRLLTVPHGKYEDEALLDHYGLTDVVKRPREYGGEPSGAAYRDNLPRVRRLINELEPRVLLFVYKGVLDKILKFAYGRREKARYGCNPDLVRWSTRGAARPRCSSTPERGATPLVPAALASRPIQGRPERPCYP